MLYMIIINYLLHRINEDNKLQTLLPDSYGMMSMWMVTFGDRYQDDFCSWGSDG